MVGYFSFSTMVGYFDYSTTQSKFRPVPTTWFSKEKPALAEINPLINLPYIIDGSIIVTQSNACLKYLGRKLNLLGANEHDLTLIEQCIFQVWDLRNELIRVCYGPKEAYEGGAAAHFAKAVPGHYSKFEALLRRQGTTYLVTKSPTAADFALWEMLDHHELWAKAIGQPSPLAAFPLLQVLYSEFRSCPKLAVFFASPLATRPINAPHAHFK
uniref:glutathione transferase n=1 Tax=Cryptomonas curvata TaxID=233186 RepID=A0A7S0QYV4_9CRYP|mmetsp:Transcript_7969/g.17003  ORF Transcript_7969/g.17003 Transcript_7969/m.17003 type:complete len:213 (+) Transcript_7969:138-776(+)